MLNRQAVLMCKAACQKKEKISFSSAQELIALLQEALCWCCSLEMADVFLVKSNMHNDAANTSFLLVLCLSCAFFQSAVCDHSEYDLEPLATRMF